MNAALLQGAIFEVSRDNIKRAIYNLTTHDLANPTYYAELKALLKSVAGE